MNRGSDFSYEIVGKNCGRGKDGVLRCVCGKCRQLRKQGDNGRYRSDDSGQSRNDTDHGGNYKSIPVSFLP